jgi:hypothetical protein
MKLITHLHLVSKWRMTGTIPQLNLHTFMGWTWKASPFLTDGKRGFSENEETSKKVLCRICSLSLEVMEYGHCYVNKSRVTSQETESIRTL